MAGPQGHWSGPAPRPQRHTAGGRSQGSGATAGVFGRRYRSSLGLRICGEAVLVYGPEHSCFRACERGRLAVAHLAVPSLSVLLPPFAICRSLNGLLVTFHLIAFLRRVPCTSSSLLFAFHTPVPSTCALTRFESFAPLVPRADGDDCTALGGFCFRDSVLPHDDRACPGRRRGSCFVFEHLTGERRDREEGNHDVRDRYALWGDLADGGVAGWANRRS